MYTPLYILAQLVCKFTFFVLSNDIHYNVILDVYIHIYYMITVKE